MADRQIAAKDFALEVNTGTYAVPAWTSIAGILGYDWSPSSTEVDITNVDSAGRMEHWIMERGDEFTVEIQKYWDKDAGPPATRDAGQAAMESLAAAVGEASLGDLRFVGPGTPYELRFYATVEAAKLGSGDKAGILTDSWKVKVSGDFTETA